ncbi:MAG: hypothetical protein B7Z35_09415 [Hydrogenophilales bacterium 12-61-10]|nr:MAG: hypothetical protein B7Z35_09415 [Hydrogenophilales bacterium 12-61-10]OYX29185.1 MAG: hypothetical protein B7Z03_09700 [Hydrogenophilales bacterium 32-62-9]
MAISKTKPFSSRLLVRPAPLKGESLRGFLLRVGERNGCGKGMNLFSALTGRENTRYMVSDQALDNIAQALALSRQQIEAISYRPVGKDVTSQCRFFGHTISVNHLRSHQPAVCPDCLAQQQAISGLWDLRAVCACPHHGKWLIDQCPACDEPLKWNRTSVANCKCGFDLRTVQTKPAPSNVLALIALVHEMVLNDLPTLAEQSLGYPEEVRQVPLNDLLGLFRYVADVLVPAHPITQEERVDGSEAFSKQSQAAVLMARLLKAWPDELSLALADLSSSDGEDAPTVLSAKKFNACYRRVMETALEPRSLCLNVPSFFKQAMQQFRDDHCISVTGEGRYLNPSLVWRAADGQRAMKWGVCLEALGFLPGEEDNLDEVTPFQIYLQKKEERLVRVLTPRQAMLWLDCCSAHLKSLTDLRLLMPLVGGDFLKSEVADVVRSFDHVAVDRKQAGPRLGALLRLTSFKRTKSDQFGRLVRAIAKKEVGLYKQGRAPARSLSDLYVAIPELRKTGHWIWPEYFTTEPR